VSAIDGILAEPEFHPLLLPWAARHAAPTDLVRVAATAQLIADPGPDVGWPVVADDTADVLARRVADGTVPAAAVEELLGALPALAGRLARLVPDPPGSDDSDAAGYIALVTGQHEARQRARADGSPFWQMLLAEQVDLPPLAHLPSLAQLLHPELDVRSPATAVYLLPHMARDDRDDPAQLELILLAMQEPVEALPWRMAGMAARAVRHLAADMRGLALDVLAVTHPDLATRLTTAPPAGSQPLGAESVLAHPQGVALLHTTALPAELTRVSRELLDRLVTTPPIVDIPDIAERPPPIRHSPQPGERWTGTYELGAEPSRPARHVTVFVAELGSTGEVTNRPLQPGVVHEVVLRVGERDPRSLLPLDPDGLFPDEHLPDDHLELDVALTATGHITTARLALPARRDSDWLRLPLPMLDEGVHTAHLGLYHRAALVFTAQLTIPVGVGDEGPAAAVTFRLSRSLSDLWWLSDRTASIAVLAGASTVLVNGLTGGVRSGRVASQQMDAATRLLRNGLFDAHLVDIRRSRYDARQAKPFDAFLADLRRLAALGQRLYHAFIGDRYILAALPYRLRDQAAAQGRPPVIQVVGPWWQGRAVPWAGIYDLPLGGEPATYAICPSLRQLADLAADPPVCCPFEDTHREGDGRWRFDQLCPWGFWGFSTMLEHPPPTPDGEPRRVVGTGTPLRYLIADGADLDEPLRSAHVTHIRARLGAGGTHLHNPRSDALRSALGTELDLVYLYCHCDWLDTPGIGSADPSLRFADRVQPDHVTAWLLASRKIWWSDRRPLVVINGCHTVELLTGSLTDFVTAFADHAGAAGVIGTEITIDQAVAGWAIELFLDALATQPVGAAIRTMRWRMLARGNVMGLAYTPYCLADLTIGPQDWTGT